VLSLSAISVADLPSSVAFELTIESKADSEYRMSVPFALLVEGDIMWLYLHWWLILEVALWSRWVSWSVVICILALFIPLLIELKILLLLFSSFIPAMLCVVRLKLGPGLVSTSFESMILL